MASSGSIAPHTRMAIILQMTRLDYVYKSMHVSHELLLRQCTCRREIWSVIAVFTQLQTHPTRGSDAPGFQRASSLCHQQLVELSVTSSNH